MVLLLHPGGSWILDLHNCWGLCLLGGLWLIIVFQPLIKLFELVTCLRYIRSPEESLLQLDRDVLVLGEELVLASGCMSATLVHIAMLTLSAWGSWQGSCVIPDNCSVWCCNQGLKDHFCSVLQIRFNDGIDSV